MAKKVLITGKDSYVGTSFIKWMADNEPETECVEISVRGEEWRSHDFSLYDSVVHVAGIAHQKESLSNKNSYYNVNYKLAVEVASRANDCGVEHFIFLSSMSVFGLNVGSIDKYTEPYPVTYYGESKFMAENEISKLMFQYLSIIRPPIIYGHNCKGNYQLLSKMSRFLPVFPNVNNSRSMIHIDNLSEFIRIVLNKKISGILHPQNEKFVRTADLVLLVRKTRGKRTFSTSLFNPLLKLNGISILDKIFGTLVYDYDLSLFELDYNVRTFARSVEISERSVV